MPLSNPCLTGFLIFQISVFLSIPSGHSGTIHLSSMLPQHLVYICTRLHLCTCNKSAAKLISLTDGNWVFLHQHRGSRYPTNVDLIVGGVSSSYLWPFPQVAWLHPLLLFSVAFYSSFHSLVPRFLEFFRDYYIVMCAHALEIMVQIYGHYHAVHPTSSSVLPFLLLILLFLWNLRNRGHIK